MISRLTQDMSLLSADAGFMTQTRLASSVRRSDKPELGFLSRERQSYAQNLRRLQATSVLCTKTSVPQAYVCLSMQDRRHLNIFPSLMYADPRRFDGYAGPRHCTDVRLTET